MANKDVCTIPAEDPGKRKWKFSELLADPDVKQKWEKVRRYFFLKESTYDMTNRCNIRCDGCYYYEGEKQFSPDNRHPESWRTLMREEKKRGINYIVLAGAEPSLVPELLEVCYSEIPIGSIATNGSIKIPDAIRYRLHISVWGNEETTRRVRKARNLLQKQINNYAGDPRAIFVYTFTKENIDEIYEVMPTLVHHNCRLTFNVFSSPEGYHGPLRHDEASLLKSRHVMLDLLRQYPDHIIFSYYNVVAHTSPVGLHTIFDCSYPRMNEATDIGLGRSFRQYRSNLSWDRSVACCVPDTDCEDCRHYAAGSAVVTARLHRHVTDPDTFQSWLDYVDTYLSVWVMDYEKGKNLCNRLVTPPKKQEQNSTDRVFVPPVRHNSLEQEKFL